LCNYSNLKNLNDFGHSPDHQHHHLLDGTLDTKIEKILLP